MIQGLAFSNASVLHQVYPGQSGSQLYCTMGPCVGKQTRTEKYRSDMAISKTSGTIFQPEDIYVPQEQPDNSISLMASLKVPDPEHYVTLEDNLRSSQVDEQVWLNQHQHAPSMIVKRTRKNRAKEKPRLQSEDQDIVKSSIMNIDCQESEIVQGVVQEDAIYSRLTLSTRALNIEFMLPKSRAGPLVVPYISYDNYDGVES